MAKWGEGDPRWKVEERTDGHNVNGWHWSEKNCLGWTKTKLDEFFMDMPLSVSVIEGNAKLVSIKSCTGDASVMMRKGNKKTAIYDLNIVFSYEGTLANEAGKTFKGEVKLNEFSSTNDEDEYEWSVTIEGKGKGNDKIKKLVSGVVQKDMIGKLRQFAQELSEVQP